MKNLLKKLGSLIGFVAEGNSNYMKLRFGRCRYMLGTRASMALNVRRPFLELQSGAWRGKHGDLCISPKFEPNPHIVISGMSGFGKSTLFKSLLLDVRKFGVSCIIFDAHDEHSGIVRGLHGSAHNAMYSGINILALDGASVSERISELTRLFKEIYGLGYIQATKLSECLWYTYRKAGARGRSDRTLTSSPSIRELLDELNIFIRNSKTVGERNTLLHLKDRMSLLNSSAFSGSSLDTKDISNGLHSFSLANMKSKEAQLIYVGELLSRLYANMHDGKRDNSLRLYIMIDEAQFLVDNSGNNSIIAKLIEEGRKYGVGVIIVTHAASTLNRKIMANSSTFVTFYAREPSEVSYISKLLSGNNQSAVDAVRNRIGALKENEAILISGRFRSPVVIETPKFDDLPEIELGIVSDSETAGLLSTIARKPIRLHSAPQKTQSADLSKLIAAGMIDRFTLDFDGKKEDWLMLHNNSISIEHEVWVAKLSELLTSANITNRIIDNSNGPDIMVLHNGKRIAVEYETGSKSSESTAKMIDARVKSYDEIIMVVNDNSFARYANSFKNNGLKIIPVDEAGSLADVVMNEQVKSNKT